MIRKKLLEQGLKHAFIQPQYPIVYIIVFLMKTLPLFVLTHDWNINSEKGAVFWIRKLSFSDFLCTNDTQTVYMVIILLIFIICVIITIFLIRIRYTFENNGSFLPIEKKLFGYISSFLFYGQFLVSQYFYSIFIEVVYCPGTNVITPTYFYVKEYDSSCRTTFYYVIVCIMILLIIEMSVLSLYISSFLYDSYFSSQSVLLISFNENDSSSFLFPLLQLLLQLEYHTTFKLIFIIKCVFRGCFMICYVTYMISNRSIYSHYYMDYCIKFIYSICFWSCVIEWAFVFDYPNDLLFIQKDISYVVIKLIIEVIAAKLTLDMYYKRERSQINAFLTQFSSKSSNHDYEIINKLFYCLYYKNNSNIIKHITTQARTLLQNGVHNPKCSEKNQVSKCLYCHKFSIDLYEKQYSAFIQQQAKQSNSFSKTVFPLSETSPLLFELIETLLLSNARKNIGNKNYINAIEMLIIFYFSFRSNYYRCLYYIEEIIRTPVFNQSLLFQIKIIKLKFSIIKKYKHIIQLKKLVIGKENEAIAHNERMKTHKEYKSVLRIIRAENLLNESLRNYLNVLRLMNNEKIQLTEFIDSISTFKMSYDMSTQFLSVLLNRDQSLFSYTTEKINLYYNYFDNDIKSHKTIKTLAALPKKYINNSPHGNYSVLILSSQFNNKSQMTFAIDYASDDLVTKLKYNSTQFKTLTTQDLFQETFTKPYSFIFEKAIQSGEDQLLIKNFCLHDKEKYVMLFNLYGIAVFSHCSAKIFAKIEEAKEQLSVNNRKTKLKNKRKGKRKRAIESFCGNCFLFASKNGKIVSICRDFESIFFLNPLIIKKNQINIKDILQLEMLGKEGEFEKDFYVIIDNIILLNNNEKGHSDDDEFSLVVNQMKELKAVLNQEKINLVFQCSFEEKKIKKAPGKEKKYYLFVFSIKSNESMTKVSKSISQNDILNDKLSSYDGLDQSFCSIRKTYSTVTKIDQGYFHSGNAYDLQEKIMLIRDFILKYLYLKYNYQTYSLYQNRTEDDYLNDLKITKGILIQQQQQNLKDKDKENEYLTNNSNNNNNNPNVTKLSAMSQPSTALFLGSSFQSGYISNCINTNRALMPIGTKYDTNSFLMNYANNMSFPKFTSQKQNCIYINIGFFFIVFIVILVKKIINLYNEIETINSYCDIFFVRNLLNEITATVLYMQFQSNSLQPEIIDYHFNNSYDYYMDELKKLNSDSNGYLKIIKTFFLKNYYQSTEKFLQDLSKPFNILTIDRFNSFINETIIIENIQTWPLLVMPITSSIRKPLIFNSTVGVVSDETDTFYANESYVKIIFNFLGGLKMLYDETINSFPYLVVKGWINAQKIYCYTLLIASNVFVVIIIVEIIIVNKYKRIQFVKYSITFAQLRFFYLVLIHKTQIIKDNIENNTEKIGNYMSNNKGGCIEIANEVEESQKLKMIFQTFIDNIDAMSIRPFALKNNYNNNTNANGNMLYTKQSYGVIQFSPPFNNMNKVSLKNFASPTNKGMKQLNYCRSIQSNSPPRTGGQNNSGVIAITPDNNIPNETSALGFTQSSKIQFQINKSSKNIPQTSLDKNMASSTRKSTNGLIAQQQQQHHISNNNNEGGKKLLQQSSINYLELIFFIILLLLLLLSSVLCVLNTIFSLNRTTDILGTEAQIFGQMSTITEMLLVYQISILQNKVFIVNYTSLGYLNNCEETRYVNNITFHNVFKEASECYSSFRKSISNITNSNKKTKFNTIKSLQNQLESSTCCEDIKAYYDKYKNDSLFPKLESWNSYSPQKLLDECERIGNGFNSKGIINAMDTMFISIQSAFMSFENDLNRTSLSNYNRFNSEDMYIFQAEIYHIFSKMTTFFVIGFENDFKSFDLKVMFNDAAVGIVMLIVCIALGIYYYIIIRIHNKKELLIEFFDARVLRSLLF